MTAERSDQPCELCGFAASQYELESDLTSTANMAFEVASDAALGLSNDELATKPDGAPHSIAELLSVVENFDGTLEETAHMGLHTMAEVGAIRAQIGWGPAIGTGSVTGLHTSGGGVPKSAIDSAEVVRSGFVGDVQNNRIHHGRPLQALCVWSQDVIEALQGEGHPIVPGQAGENITVSGLDWETLRPGSRIRVADIPILLSSYAVPCSKVGPGFVDRNFRRILHSEHDGWSRLYGIPLAEGTVSLGDTVAVEA